MRPSSHAARATSTLPALTGGCSSRAAHWHRESAVTTMATVSDRAPKRMFQLPALSPPSTSEALPRVWAQAPFVNTGLTTVEIGAVAGCGMLSDGVGERRPHSNTHPSC